VNICVVIPIYNEAVYIGDVVSGIRAKGLPVVVVDDGSTDNGGDKARKAGAAVLTNAHREGKGGSLQRGFRHAMSEGYDGVITMDGDGQHDPQDLDHFAEVIEEHPDAIVTANRMTNVRNMPLIRRLTNRAMSAVISVICRQTVPDTQCGFRYIPREILTHLDLSSRTFEIETEVLIKASRQGCRIFSVPIQTIYRDEDSKINPWKDTVKFIIYLSKEMICSGRKGRKVSS